MQIPAVGIYLAVMELTQKENRKPWSLGLRLENRQQLAIAAAFGAWDPLPLSGPLSSLLLRNNCHARLLSLRLSLLSLCRSLPQLSFV